MDCQEAKSLFYKCIDHELSLPEEKSLYSHLRVCRMCSMEFDQALETHKALEKLIVPVTPPLDLTSRIMAAYDLSCTQVNAAKPEQVSGLWERFLDSWKRLTGNRQFRLAVVSMAVLAVVLFTSSIGVPGLKIAGTQQPEVNIIEPDPLGTVTVPEDPAESEKDPADGSPEETKEPDNSPPVEADPGTSQNEPGLQTPVEQEKIPPVTGENVIPLPHASSGPQHVASVEVSTITNEIYGQIESSVLSDDGKTVYYATSSDDETELWGVELKEGAVPQPVEKSIFPNFEDSSDQDNPAWWPGSVPVEGAVSVTIDWSPDKKQMAVNLRNSSESDGGIWVVQADGSMAIQVAQVGGGRALSWSPDGLKIAFTDSSDNVYVLYVSENVLVQVTNSGENFSKVGQLNWSSDNKKIVFDGKEKGDSARGIYMITLP